MTTEHIIITGDSSDLVNCVQDSTGRDKVDLIVTSPPYPMISMWDDCLSKQNQDVKVDLEFNVGIGAFNKMHKILEKTWDACDSLLRDGGFICINIGDATRTIGDNFMLYPNAVRITDYFMNTLNYTVLPEIIWKKPSNAPNKFMGSGTLPCGAYVTLEHEHILIFRKGGKRDFSKEEDKKLRRESSIFWEERNQWFSDTWTITGTSQKIKTDKGCRDRNASYPIDIPYRLVNMFSVKGDTVLDPFSGLGTTSVACMASGRNSVGVDIDKDIAELSIERLQNADAEYLSKIVEDRLEKHLEFIDGLPEDKKQKCYENDNHKFKVKTRQETDLKVEKIDSIESYENKVIVNYV